jgi:CRP/FNR family transcriptional regulator
MSRGALGKLYQDGQEIIRQGEVGHHMFVIQEGQARVLVEKDGEEMPVRVAQEGELLGEMAIFEKEVRSATVRALGEARVLTIDKKNFFRRISEDPSIAFRIVQTMSRRVRELTDHLVQLEAELEAAKKEE